MGRAPCCEKVGLKRGRWTVEEDKILTKYIQANGEGSWRSLPKKAGLLRCGKSCRLRWINYLRSDVKRGNITPQEEEMIVKLHNVLGNRWSLIATHLAGRTDNEIKNYWNSHLSRKAYAFTTKKTGDEMGQLLDELLSKRPTSFSSAKPCDSMKKKKKGRTSRSAMKKHKQMVMASSSVLKQKQTMETTGLLSTVADVIEGSLYGEDKTYPENDKDNGRESSEKGHMGHFEGEVLGPYEWLDSEIERFLSRSSGIGDGEEVIGFNNGIESQYNKAGENGDTIDCALGSSEEKQRSGAEFDHMATKTDIDVEREREECTLTSNSDEGCNEDWWVGLCSTEEISFGFDWDFLNLSDNNEIMIN